MKVIFFTIAREGDSKKTTTCAKPMRVRFVLLKVFPLQMTELNRNFVA